ncbi:lecithin retinol acyltransferase family protein [Oceanisphaera avium]|uniref:LRAT domain-containing protein n=1 Tax=Oceanisphaera avium TaxID=1903694 RepID=A0A1Y0CVG3_9GAMM|nr:lecithin retinol acyltransferase family protein [Oceanisphaera avium]ART78916.1 hypothetical protein CBP12_01105 [Oceanisphaera avium]
MNTGTHLISYRFGYSHHGLYVGDNQVIHYAGSLSGEETGRIELSTLEDFTQGNGFHIKHHPVRYYDDHESVDRAYARLGEENYHVLLNNCEHFVIWCIQGFSYSHQVTRAINSGMSLQRLIAGAPTTAQKLPSPFLIGQQLPLSSHMLQGTSVTIVDTLINYGINQLFRWLKHR